MPKTYNDLYLATRTALKNAGVEAYALEARLLVAYAVGKTKEEFVRDLRLYTSDENEQKIAALLQRRIAGEPLAYLIGEWEFHGLPIVVTPDVLIPRMDTEVLVDAALRVLVGRKMNARILDLCSGSGCIGCALAHELLKAGEPYTLRMLAINGGDLIRAGVKPGPELGQLLNAALDAVIEDNIPNEREALLVHLNLN